MVAHLRHPAYRWSGFLLGLLLLLDACSEAAAPTVTAPARRVLKHTTLAYRWVVPGDYRAEERTTPPGWLFWHPEGALVGGVWIRAFDPQWAAATEITLLDLERIADQEALELEQALGTLAPLVVRWDASSEGIGRERFGAPVVTRSFVLELHTLEPRRPDQVLAWLGATLAGTTVDPAPPSIGTEARNWRILVALTPLRDGFGKLAVDATGRNQLVVAAWAGIPERFIAADQFVLEAEAYAERFPIASRHAELRTVAEELAPPTTRPTILLLIGLEVGAYSLRELERLQDELRTALEPVAAQDGVLVRAALFATCDDALYVPGVGADPWTALDDDTAIGTLLGRLARLPDETNCAGNRPLGAAATIATSLGTQWTAADARWLLWLVKGRDFTSDREVALATLRTPPVRIDAVGSLEQGCDGTDTQIEPGATQALLTDPELRELGLVAYEYCARFGNELAYVWRSRLARWGGLALRWTPLPGSLEVRLGNQRLSTTDPQKGVRYDPATGALVTGELVKVGPTQPLAVRYAAWIEPEEASGLGASGR